MSSEPGFIGCCHASTMRKILIGWLGLYLVCGFVFGLMTHRETYICPRSDAPGEYAALPPGDSESAEGAPTCEPNAVRDELPWVAIATPAWLPLVVRNALR
jgi:hypothetical protein